MRLYDNGFTGSTSVRLHTLTRSSCGLHLCHANDVPCLCVDAQPPGMSNYVEYGGNYYGTLADVGGWELCQSIPSSPEGAAIAPDTLDVVSKAVAAHV